MGKGHSVLKKGDATVRLADHHEVVIIGGGIGGLHTAFRLIEGGKKDVKIYEGRGGLGGRVTTTRDKDGKALFNNFAWRVGETNTNMIALCKEIGVKLIEQFTPEHTKHKGAQCDGGCDESSKIETHKPPDGRAPLSAYATHCLKSTQLADKQDRESGYAGRTAQVSFPGESHGSKNYIVENGMNRIATVLGEKLPEGVVNTNVRCTDVMRVDGKYVVELLVRNKNEYTPKVVTCDTLILAAPPVSLRGFTISKDGLMPALSAIHQRRLTHCYVKSTDKDAPDTSTDKDRIYQGYPDSILQQVISGDYGGGVFQAAYACDRFERVWRELQYQGPAVVKQELESQLAKIKLPNDRKTPTIDTVHLRSGFVHRWHIESHVNGKNKEDLMNMAVYPNAERFPGLHLVGEAYSSQQGWTEGALLTSQLAVDYVLKSAEKSKSKYGQPVALPGQDDDSKEEEEKKMMCYRGVMVDTSEWENRHPGGVGMIKYHQNEDLSFLFDNYHGGWPAPLATLFGLQCGVSK